VLEAWRWDYNEARPHSKLGWMTPLAYASALRAETGLVAPDSYARAPNPLATHDKQGSNQPRTLIMAGMKNGGTSAVTNQLGSSSSRNRSLNGKSHPGFMRKLFIYRDLFCAQMIDSNP